MTSPPVVKPKHGQRFGKIHGLTVAMTANIPGMKTHSVEIVQRQPALAAKPTGYPDLLPTGTTGMTAKTLEAQTHCKVALCSMESNAPAQRKACLETVE